MTFSSFEKNKSLKDICTFGIGGPADFYIPVKTIEGLQTAIKTCNENKVPFFILGKGSNLLFDDKGYRGAVIHNKIDFFEEQPGGFFSVGAGFSFSLLGIQTATKGWSGLEFASGIPGSVGGAVFMNAGANGEETWNTLKYAAYVSNTGDVINYEKESLSFSYRNSSFHQLKGAIAAACFQLTPYDRARKKQLDILAYRLRTQPLKEKSAGCLFRNPGPNLSAGALIDQCGLKGYAIGGAKVSPQHANFIVNSGNGSAEDVRNLCNYIKEIVYKKSGIVLEQEVRFIPEADS